MKKTSIIGFVLALLPFGTAFAQQADTVNQMPHLEIPEITIIGKKAITLPFARKGEIYDIDLYEAPQPDVSLFGPAPSMSLLRGSLPRYRQEEKPWRLSLEGLGGSFGTMSGRGFLNYIGQQWGADWNLGFKKTNGHTDNADATSFKAGAGAHSLFRTDNTAFKTFRASVDAAYEHNRYGLFGIPGGTARRRLSDFELRSGFNSLNREGTVIDIDLAAMFESLNDSNLGIDSSVSSVSPDLSASLSADIKSVRLSTGISYRNTSPDYSHPTQAPSMVDYFLSARFNLNPAWSIEAGGRVAHSENNIGGERSLVTPFGSAKLILDSTFSVSLWFKPEMQFTSYPEYVKRIPYLAHEFTIDPERRPVVIGSSFFYNNGPLSLEVRGSFLQSTNTPVVLSDSGRIRLDYVEATQTALNIEGALQLTNITKVLFSASVTGAYEKDSSSQLPMIPVVRMDGTWETDFRIPIKAWSTVEYLSKRNIDRAGTRSLGDVFLVNAGASTDIIPRIALAAELKNLFDVNYEWWNGYRAPGVQFNVTAKINIQ